MTRYRCKLCGKVVERELDTAWIRSWCEETSRDTRIWRVEEET